MRYVWAGIGIASLLISVAVSPPPTAATSDQPSTWRMVGQVGGPTQGVAVQGDFAYVGVGLRLVVLDVSNPITPTEVGSTTPFPYFVEDVVISGTLAYVAAGGAGLRVVSILTPTAPVEVGFWDSPGYAEGVAVSGNTVYLADGPYGLWTVDVSDPAHPTPGGSAYDMNYAFEVAVSGHRAYIAAAGAGLLVADVSNPAQPVEVGGLDTPGYAYGVAGRAGRPYVYVADAWEGLRVVNVFNPANPVEVGACDTPGWALHVAVAGTTAYVADGAGGLRIVDVSNPADPNETGVLEGMGLARRVAVAEAMAYVADLRGGLRLVDVSDGVHPAEVAQWWMLTEARRAAVNGEYAYVAAGFQGLQVVDVSDPAHPTEVGAYDTEGSYASSVVVSGTYAYLGAFLGGPWGLHVLDVSTPTHPVRVSFFPTPFGAYRDIVLVGQILYIADEWGLSLIDVSNPALPAQVGFIQLNQNQQDTIGVAVSLPLAYLADAHDGMKIVDVSNPYTPTLVGVYDPIHWVDSVAVSGTLAYVGDHGGLRIVDVAHPDAPVEIGSYDTPDIVNAVAVSGTTAYLSTGGAGMIALEVSNPLAPTLIAIVNTPGVAWHAALADNYAYVADGYGGLLILEKTVGDAVGRFGPRPTYLASRGVSDPVRLPESGIMTSGPATPPSAAGTEAGPVGDTPVPSPRTSLLAAAHIVTSALDSGPGTLRQALLDAGPGDIITFDPDIFPPTSPVTIGLSAPLPPLSQGHLTVDASNAGVILDGSHLTEEADGLLIISDDNTVRGLQIRHFHRCGVFVNGWHNVIGGSRALGMSPAGQGNVLSGNHWGICVYGEQNLVLGNLVGTDATGTTAIPNEIGVGLGGRNNRLGGPTPDEQNIISGNWDKGVNLLGEEVTGNVVAGNYIGPDVTGTRALGNGRGGVIIECGASGNTVGGDSPGERNVISGNRTGVGISDRNTRHNTVIGNFIGTDASGTAALGNEFGISICASGFNRIGGTHPGERNVISGNTGTAIQVPSWGDPDNLVLGNYIGVDVSGTRALGNGAGVGVDGSGRRVFVGGATAAERNVIGDNGAGVNLEGAGVEYNWIVGNYIGVGSDGVTPLGHRWAGLFLWKKASRNLIQGNRLAYTGEDGPYPAGIAVVQSSSFNTIRRNSIYSNLGRGIFLADGGNQMLPAPAIFTVTETSMSGTACPGCTVEVFSDDEDEGRVYEGNTVADGTGTFTFARPAGFTGPNVIATATDSDGNTSEFSTPSVMWRRIYLPVILRSW